MLTLRSQRSLVFAAILSLFVAIALPSVTFAGQGRGNGQERRSEKRNDNRYNRDAYSRNGNNGRNQKKAVRFINGHDARDGRWDGHGPQRNQSLYRSDWNNRHRNANRNQRRYNNRQDQYRNGWLYDNVDYRRTYSTEPERDILGSIVRIILGGQ